MVGAYSIHLLRPATGDESIALLFHEKGCRRKGGMKEAVDAALVRGDSLLERLNREFESLIF